MKLAGVEVSRLTQQQQAQIGDVVAALALTGDTVHGKVVSSKPRSVVVCFPAGPFHDAGEFKLPRVWTAFGHVRGLTHYSLWPAKQ